MTVLIELTQVLHKQGEIYIVLNILTNENCIKSRYLMINNSDYNYILQEYKTFQNLIILCGDVISKIQYILGYLTHKIDRNHVAGTK